jgi:glycosyltransferase involved in cell wall biosynthesis
MSSVAHLVVTDNFAGTERYVCQLANASARDGWQVSVIGGDHSRMRRELADEVRWLAGATPVEAAKSLYRLGRQDVCHAHLTSAELVAAALRLRHQARVISTRHIAAPRGSSRLGRLVAPWVARQVDGEIAISHFVAERVGATTSATIHNGVPPSRSSWNVDSKVVLLVQRLEPEKETQVALQAWQLSELAEQGWRLRIVGDGSERAALQAQVARDGTPNVDFMGARNDVDRQLALAGIFLATAPREPLGLSVLEAMAAGIPVVASQGGGHLETLAPQAGLNGFPPGDFWAAADCLARLGTDADLRRELSVSGRERQRSQFTLEQMVEQIHQQYHSLTSAAPGSPRPGR